MKKRLLAGFLTVTMLMSLFPLPALALEGQRPEWAVTAFDPLDEGTALQTVTQGGGEPVLPDTLTAWAYRIKDDTEVIVPPEGTEQTPPADGQEEPPAPGEDSGGADPAPIENGGEADPAPVEDGGDAVTAALVENDPAPAEKQEPDIQQITIPGVTWTAEPEYDHNTPGEYIYTPVLPAAYAVDEGVELPTITVTVEAAREPEQTAVERVQALIDALPDPEGITADNAEDVAAQLAAINEESESLTEEELAGLDFARYEAVMLALAALMDDTPALLATASNIKYLDCDANGKNWTTKTCSSATVVESGTTTWNTGWYVVNSNVTVGSRITVNGTVHLILANNSKLNAENGGINVSDGNSLTIYAQSTGDSMGQLSAQGGNKQAGIGGNESEESAGTITINGGDVTATGGGYAAGIGGGEYNAGGTITINGGNVTAAGGESGAGIGGGDTCMGGTITINGGNVTATGGGWSAGIGGGGKKGAGGTITINGGSVTATGGSRGAGIGGAYQGAGGAITISGGNVTATNGDYGAGIGPGESSTSSGTFSTGTNGGALILASSISDQSKKDNWSGIIIQGDSGQVYGSPTLTDSAEISSGKTLTVPSGTTLTIPSGVTLTNNGTIIKYGTIINNGTITGSGKLLAPENVSYINEAGVECGASCFSIPDQTTWAAGWYVVDSSTTISDRITVNGSVNLILNDGCTLTASQGIAVNDPNSLTVYCQSGRTGALIATNPSDGGAAIGADKGTKAGSVTVNGGNITATVQNGGGACIGMGGWSGQPGSVTINGGYLKLTSKAGEEGAFGGSSTRAINGGVVEYTGDRDTIGSNLNNCIVFKKEAGQVYGDAVLPFNYTIPNGKTLTIPEGKTLTVSTGKTLTNSGTLKIDGALTVNGTFTNSSTTQVKVTLDANGGSVTSASTYVTYGGNYGTLTAPTRDSYTFAGWYTAASGGTQVTSTTRVTITAAQTLYARWSTLKVTGGTLGTDYSFNGTTLNILTGTTLTISGTTTTENIVVGNGVQANLILNGLSVDMSSIENKSALDLNNAGASTITLAEGSKNTLKGGKDRPGLYVPNGKKLTITGTGELEATGGLWWPGIGRMDTYDIEFNGGTIKSYGGQYAAGIGGSNGHGGGTITINSGVIYAQNGPSSSAGIGSDSDAANTINIYGGEVHVTGYLGEKSSSKTEQGSAITIQGGVVSVTGHIGGRASSTLSTGTDGNAVIYTNEVKAATSGSWSCVLFQKNSGTVYGSPALTHDLTITENQTLTIPTGTTLTINSGVTVTVQGDVDAQGTTVNNGTISKKAQTAPSAPTASAQTASSITLNAVSGGKGGVEYKCGDGSWQTGTAFNSLTAATGYTFSVRYKGNAYYQEASSTATIYTASAAPTNPAECYEINYSAETVTARNGYEISTDGTSGWTTGAVSVTPGSTIYVRVAAVSGGAPASEKVSSTLPNRPEKPTNTDACSIDTSTERITVKSGYEANTNANFGSGTNVTDGTKINPGATFYARKAATDSSFSSTAQTITAPSRGMKPSVSINYTAETLTTTTAMEYTTNGGTSWTDCTAANMAATAFGWDGTATVTVQFRTKATSTTYASEAQDTLTIPARPEAPKLSYNPNTEQVEITSGTYYYNTTSADYTNTWTKATGNFNVTPGTTVYIYAPATASAFKSAIQTLKAQGRGEAPKNLTINYTAETINTTAGMEWNTDKDSSTGWQGCGDNMSVTTWADTGKTVYIRYKAADGNPASNSTEVTIPKRPVAPSGLTIDNAAEGVTLSNQYCYNSTSETYTGAWAAGTGSNVMVQPEAKIYICTPATDNTLRSAVLTLTAPSRGSTPTVNIDYTAETLGTTTAMQYKVGTGSWADCEGGMAATAFGWNGTTAVKVQFRTKATEDNYASEAVEVTIPARPTAPSVQGANETFLGENDGQITGTSTAMEYKLSTAGSWTACGGTSITSLAPGTYYVRAKAVTGLSPAFASVNATVEIEAGPERTYTLEAAAPTFDAVTYGYAQPAAKAITITSSGNSAATITSVAVSGDFTIGGSGESVAVGGSITSWTVQPNTGLGVGTHTGTITVTYNNDATATADVSFTVSKATLTPTASADNKTYDGTTTATGTISFTGAASGESPTASGNFAFEDADAGTGKKVNVTNIKLDDGWVANYQLSSNSTTTTANITPKSITGTISITGTATMGETLTASNSASGETVNYQWYRGDNLISGATGNTYTLVADDVGKAIKVTATGTGNYTGTATSSPTAAVGNATPTVSQWPTASAITYGQSLGDSTLTGGTASVAGTFTWTNTSTKPAVADSGTQYDVTFTPSVDGYNTITGGKVTLTVSKAALTPSATADGKTYDGTTTATGTISLSGAVNSEAPTASGDFAFANADAGTDKTVNVTNITLTGDWGTNYQLSTTSTTTTATIEPKSISGATVTLGDSLTYTGQQQEQTVSKVEIGNLTATYTVSNDTGTDAKSYTLTVTGTDNFTGSQTKEFTIAKASNSITSLTCGNIVFGETPNPSATATFGTPAYSFSNQQDGTYGTWNTSNGKGTWYVKATVTGTDNYDGAEATAAFQVTAQREDTPTASIDYGAETLTGLTAGASYSITPEGGAADTFTADENGTIDIRPGWFGKTLSIVKKASTDDYSDSGAQSLLIPARPAAPSAKITVKKTNTSITITNETDLSDCEFSVDGTTWKDSKEFTGLTAGQTYPVSVRTKATSTAFASASQTVDVTTVNADGSTTLKPGESAETGTDPKTTVTNDGEKVTITTGDTTTTVTPPPGGEVKPKGDGTVEVPDGTIVKPGNGGPDIAVGPGNGGTVDGDGNVTVGGGGKVTVEGEPDDTTITLPSGGGTVQPKPGGTVDVPDGTTVKTGDGPEVTVGPGNGGTIGGNGGVTVPEGGTIQIGKDPATTVTPPKGGEVKPKEDGTVEVPEGTIVKPGGGGPEVTVGPGNGGTVGDDGGVTVPGGGKVTVKGDPDTIITLPLPDGGTVKPNPDGTIPLPGGTVVTPSGKDPITVPDGGGTYDPEDGTVTENVHTVTFDSQGGSDVGSKTATHGGTVANPGSPTRSGYTFGGWYKESSCTNAWNFDTDIVTGDITLYAKWTENTPVHTHSYSSAWSSDANHHWHECSCGEKSAIAAHTPGEWIIDQEATSTMAGSRHKACTVCGYITQTESILATGGGPSGDNSGGGGGWYNPSTTYPVTTPATFPHGKLTVSPSRAERNTTVTITAIPDDGYRLGVLNVTSGGKAIPLTEKGGGKYTFTMPAGTVKVEATFVPAEVPGTPWINPFADVPEGVWYYDAVRFVSENGLMSGYGNGLFGVNDNLSRAQLAQILFNKEGRPVVNYLLQYGDVATGTWYTEAIRWATSQGIVGGYGNGNFGPNDPITREQLAVMLWRYSGSPAATNKELHFNDTDEISGFSLEALRWAVENGIINGYGDGRLGPQGLATRAQVAQMLKNFLENREDED